MISRGILTLLRPSFNYLRPWRPITSDSSVPSVRFDGDKFQAVLDMQKFECGNITVEVMDNVVTVEGKEEKKPGGQTHVARHFVKEYVLPKGYYDMEKAESKLSSDGILVVTVPRYECEGDDCCRRVPVEKTGKPFKKC